MITRFPEKPKCCKCEATWNTEQGGEKQKQENGQKAQGYMRGSERHFKM